MERVDLAGLLQRCLRARGLRVTVQVLLNDTTGTLVAGAQQDPDVVIAFILGTGMAYLTLPRSLSTNTPCLVYSYDVAAFM